MSRRFAIILASLVLFGTLLSATAQSPLTVRIGFNPTQNSEQLSAATQAIADFLEGEFGGTIEVAVFLPT